MAEWKFVTNHGSVLALIARHGQITARDIAAGVSITERSVRRIIDELEWAGYLVKDRDGRLNRYEVNHELSLRHPEDREIAVGDLLKVLVGALDVGPASDEDPPSEG